MNYINELQVDPNLNTVDTFFNLIEFDYLLNTDP